MRWSKIGLSTKWPESQRSIESWSQVTMLSVTFGKELGFEVIGLQGMSTTIEAGLADRANLVDFIKSQNIPAIFVESSVNPAAMREIANESDVFIGGELFSDALGPPGETIVGPDGQIFGLDSWGGMMVHNVTTIVEALGKTE